MSVSLKTSTRNKALDAITTDAGTTAYLFVYSGSAPAKSSNAFVAPTGTLLAKFALPNPIAPASATGVLTLSAITSVTGSASGTPGYARICTASTDTDGSGCIFQCDAGVGSGSLNFSSTISSGGSVGISSFTISEGNP